MLSRRGANMKGKGFFITVEGGDGAGKSTQLAKLKEYMKDKGFDTVFTREPGGTDIGEKIRTIILDVENGEMADHTEAYLYAASRAQNVRQIIRPALEEGKVVVCDRFVDSSIAYQGYGRGLGMDRVWSINKDAVDDCIPDLTIFLDLDPMAASLRVDGREGKKDRLEISGESFHEKVYQGYKEMIARQESGEIWYDGRTSEVHRMVSIKANRKPEEVWESIKEVLDERMKDFGDR